VNTAKEVSSSIKDGEFFGHLRKYELLNVDSTPWIYLILVSQILLTLQFGLGYCKTEKY
jgi:hypothetical protein